MQGLLRDGRTSSTVNSPMEVVHLAVGLPDMVAKVARAMRAVEGTMRAVGLSARVAAAENIISVSVSVIGGPRLVVLGPGGWQARTAAMSRTCFMIHTLIYMYRRASRSRHPRADPPIRTRLARQGPSREEKRES